MVIDIGATEPFDTHAAEMLAGFNEHDPLPHRHHLHGGDDTSTRPAVDADVGIHHRGCRHAAGKQSKQQMNDDVKISKRCHG